MRSKIFYLTFFILLPAVLGLGAAEAYLRAYDPLNMRAGWITWTEVDPSAPRWLTTNQLGYRGRGIEVSKDALTIILVGDSQLECRACPDGNIPEDMLRNALAKKGVAARVFSLGAAGYGADQELLALRRYFKLGFSADLVIVWQTATNDLLNAMFPNMGDIGTGLLKPTFRLDRDGHLIEPDGDIGDFFCRCYLVCAYRQFRYGSMDAWIERHLPPAVVPIDAAPAGVPIIDTTDPIEHEKTAWSLWLDEPSPRGQYAINLSRALYRSMSGLAKSNGARLFLFDVNRMSELGLRELSDYPLFQDGKKILRRNGKLFAIGGHDAYQRTVDILNKGFPLISVIMDIPDHVVSPADGHLNERGTRRAMELLAEELVR